MRKHCVFVAAAGKNAGKTSTCMGIVKGLQNLLGKSSSKGRVGYLKPLGQKLLKLSHGDQTIVVDKDITAFSKIFGCTGTLCDMSPVIVDRKYTRRYLLQEICPEQEFKKIQHSFHSIWNDNDFTVVEGAGHTAVGSVVKLSNASIAARLGVPMILVLNAGIGSTIDEFTLNREFCISKGALLCGVVINKVCPQKIDEVKEYTQEFFSSIGCPVIGYIPDDESCSSKAHDGKITWKEENCAMRTASHYEKHLDFETLFEAIDHTTKIEMSAIIGNL